MVIPALGMSTTIRIRSMKNILTEYMAVLYT
jgi:hypothetical protein